MTWLYKHFKDLTTEEFHDMVHLRERVFIIEQNCVYLDVDGLDKESWHLFRYDSAKKLVTACLRAMPPGVKYPEASLGRVVTAPEIRGQGAGRDLMTEALKRVDETFGKVALRISAQAYLERFYSEFGFTRVSDNYLEDNIPHCEMLRPG